MAPQLTVVVTCTDRKTLVPPPPLHVRSVSGRRIESRLDRWIRRVDSASVRKDLGALYKGEAWQMSLELTRVAAAKGFKVDTLVVSAGLGMRNISDLAPAYSATFSPGHPDSVGPTWHEATEWWNGLLERTPGPQLGVARGPTVLVMSEAYARVTNSDLIALGGSGAPATIFGGWRDVPGIYRVASDATLRGVLGGTCSSLNQRMAVKWLEMASSAATLGDAGHWRRWRRWTAESRHREVYDRTVLTDHQVEKWVRRARHRDPGLSASRALRLLREEGFACEQRRFASLFRVVED